jgi:sodium/bile acid cotransporter 7
MIVATTVPCTLATAAVWTRRARGNEAVAFLVTVITNLICFVVIPTWLWLLVEAGAKADIRRAEIDYGRIALGLILLVVLPIVIAQLLRQLRAVGTWAIRRKEMLSGIAQFGVLLMVLIGAVRCGESLNAVANGPILSAGNILRMVLGVTTIHATLLSAGFGLSHWFQHTRADAIAVAFSGSQKTLMVGAYLALAVGPLAILPMVAYHAMQLVIDTLIAEHLRERNAEHTS